MTPRPVVFLSDFGSTDPYVGQVKGVLHRHAPGLVCIDLHHDLPPFAIASAAWLLERCLPHMPENAVWLGVVDPGVGSARLPMALQWREALFVGPDNGLFTPILRQEGWRAVALQNLPSPRSATFHGRDLFAPAAARLALGTPLETLGPPLPHPVTLPHPGWQATPDGWEAEVMLTDRYGNLITALPGEVLPPHANVTGWLGEHPCGVLAPTFSSVAVGHSALVIGGFGTLEVVVNQGSAAARFAGGPGSRLRIEIPPPSA